MRVYTNKELLQKTPWELIEMQVVEGKLSDMRYQYFLAYTEGLFQSQDVSDFEGAIQEESPSEKDLYFLLEWLEELNKDSEPKVDTHMLSDVMDIIEDMEDYDEDLYDRYESILFDQYDKVEAVGNNHLKLYVIKNGEGHIKIGVTKGLLKTRFASIQTGCSSRLQFIKAFHCGSNTHLEKELHYMFTKDRLVGEWFNGRITEDVLSYCESLGLDEITHV